MTKTAKEVLLLTIKNNPKESEKGIRDLMAQAFEASAALRDELYTYWVTNHWRAHQVTESPNGSSNVRTLVRRNPKAARARVAVIKRGVKAIVDAVLMDFVMPNGKRLRDSTFGECSRLEGWMGDIARHASKNGIPPNSLVGRAMSEQDLRNLRMRNTAKAA